MSENRNKNKSWIQRIEKAISNNELLGIDCIVCKEAGAENDANSRTCVCGRKRQPPKNSTNQSTTDTG